MYMSVVTAVVRYYIIEFAESADIKQYKQVVKSRRRIAVAGLGVNDHGGSATKPWDRRINSTYVRHLAFHSLEIYSTHCALMRTVNNSVAILYNLRYVGVVKRYLRPLDR